MPTRGLTPFRSYIPRLMGLELEIAGGGLESRRASSAAMATSSAPETRNCLKDTGSWNFSLACMPPNECFFQSFLGIIIHLQTEDATALKHRKRLCASSGRHKLRYSVVP
nr:hypothetical protein Iba_chr10dCG5880 [Ipomoea batatas]